MTKHRKTRRSQKGGLFGFFETPDPYAPKKPSLMESMFGTSTSTGTGTGYQNPTQPSSFFGSSSQPQSQSSSFFGSSNPNQSQSSSFFGNSNPNKNQGSFQSPAGNSSYGSGSGYGYGGKRGKRSMTKGMTKGKTMKGGKGGLGLSYYASPVSDLKVAEPTSWQYYANGTNQYSVTGGSKKRKNRTRKSRKLTKGKSRK